MRRKGPGGDSHQHAGKWARSAKPGGPITVACQNFTEFEIRDRLAEYGTATMGWYPLGHGDRGLVNEEVFTKLADTYRKSNAQIVLRWHTQMGFITIPGSKNPDHIRDNGYIFDFSLTEEEMAEIANLDGTRKYYHVDEEQVEKYATMHLPFEG